MFPFPIINSAKGIAENKSYFVLGLHYYIEKGMRNLKINKVCICKLLSAQDKLITNHKFNWQQKRGSMNFTMPPLDYMTLRPQPHILQGLWNSGVYVGSMWDLKHITGRLHTHSMLLGLGEISIPYLSEKI